MSNDDTTSDSNGQWVPAGAQNKRQKLELILDIHELPEACEPEMYPHEAPSDLFDIDILIDSMTNDDKRFRVFETTYGGIIGLYQGYHDDRGNWYLFEGRPSNTFDMMSEVATNVNGVMDGTLQRRCKYDDRWHNVPDGRWDRERFECDIDSCRGHYWYEEPDADVVQTTVEVAFSSCEHGHPDMNIHQEV